MERRAERCGNLRWKGLFIDVEGNPNEDNSHEHIYWCVHTQICIGPDGEGVDGDVCNVTRACYQGM